MAENNNNYRAIVNEMGRQTGAFLNGFCKAEVGLFLAPYVTPTTRRVVKECIEKIKRVEKVPSDEMLFGYSFGFIAGVLTTFGEIYLYSYLITHDHPESLLIPVTTNLASAGYELYKKTKEEIKERNQFSQLEQTVKQKTNKPWTQARTGRGGI
ncbi:MAG: hypothetical protein WC548_02045 [Candidatus Pacearchaeota archaeon]